MVRSCSVWHHSGALLQLSVSAQKIDHRPVVMWLCTAHVLPHSAAQQRWCYDRLSHACRRPEVRDEFLVEAEKLVSDASAEWHQLRAVHDVNKMMSKLDEVVRGAALSHFALDTAHPVTDKKKRMQRLLREYDSHMLCLVGTPQNSEWPKLVMRLRTLLGTDPVDMQPWMATCRALNFSGMVRHLQCRIRTLRKKERKALLQQRMSDLEDAHKAGRTAEAWRLARCI